MFTVKEILEATSGKLVSGKLSEHFNGVSINSRTVKNNEIFIAIKGDNFDGHDFITQALERGTKCIIVKENEASGKKAIVLDSKFSCSIISVKDTKRALADLAYHHRKRFGIPVIAVTGSNGKTTTKEMLACLLSSKYKVLKNEGTQNNIIGLALNLFKLTPEHKIAVFEIGTNHFGEIEELARVLAPSVGIITNIGPAHLEFFSDTRGVLKEKWSLAKELSWPRVLLVNADDPLLKEKLAKESEEDLRIFTFGVHNPADCAARKISTKNGRVSFLINNFPISLNTLAVHNVYNALAAYLAARIFSVDGYDIINKFKKFEFPTGRFQVKKIKGLNIIDDAYNANPASFRRALESFMNFKSPGQKIVLVGDMLELGEGSRNLHWELGKDLSKSGVNRIIAVGNLAHFACDTAVEFGFSSQAVHKCLSAKEARNIISSYAKEGDCLLLKGSRANKLEDAISFPV